MSLILDCFHKFFSSFFLVKYRSGALFCFLFCFSSSALAQPFGGPPQASGWKYQGHLSNEFNYPNLSHPGFSSSWQTGFINGAPGSNISVYGHQAYIADNRVLAITATINNGTLFGGTVHSKHNVIYPVYIEARAKISNSSLASNVWMLNSNSTQEIDVLEAWGSKSNAYFAPRLHLSHHIFNRNPVNNSVIDDYQPTSSSTYYQRGDGVHWADDYHVFGVLWDGPYSLHYFVDGVWVRSTPFNEIDPRNYEGGLNDAMQLIINTEAQTWRATNDGLNYFADGTVTNAQFNTMYVDWIRVWKP